MDSSIKKVLDGEEISNTKEILMFKGVDDFLWLFNCKKKRHNYISRTLVHYFRMLQRYSLSIRINYFYFNIKKAFIKRDRLGSIGFRTMRDILKKTFTKFGKKYQQENLKKYDRIKEELFGRLMTFGCWGFWGGGGLDQRACILQ